MASLNFMAFSRKRVRGSNLEMLVPYKKGLPMDETIRLADDMGLVLASNRRIAQALSDSGQRHLVINELPCWTGTMAAYEKPGKKLGKAIIHQKEDIKLVFPVPEEHRGKRNILLVSEHPHFTLVEEGNYLVVLATEVGAIERFPKEYYGSSQCDKRYGLPSGDMADENDRSAIHYWRGDRWVGLVSRSADFDDIYGVGRREMNLDYHGENSVIVEAPGAYESIEIKEEKGRLIVVGSPAQIAAASRLLEKVK